MKRLIWGTIILLIGFAVGFFGHCTIADRLSRQQFYLPFFALEQIGPKMPAGMASGEFNLEQPATIRMYGNAGKVYDMEVELQNGLELYIRPSIIQVYCRD